MLTICKVFLQYLNFFHITDKFFIVITEVIYLNTRKAFVILLLIFLMPMLPMLISRGWDPKLTVPKNSQTPIKEDISEYADVTIKVLHKGIVQNIPLFDYLCGVVSNEMPATFETEALKAQAVAACSYTVYKMQAQKENPGLFPEHNGAYVCSDPAHCKAYADIEERKQMWGDSYQNYNAKIESAVSQVLGYILTYQGEPANAVFHAISSGKTENAEDVWGSEIPYLISVDSMQDISAEGYESEVTIEKTAFLEKLTPHLEKSTDKIIIGEIDRSEAGSVKTIILCEQEFTGAKIREIFSLRSSNFSISESETDITFSVKGYGHGVGMSQNGANLMAKDGASYTDILRKYYSGTVLEKYEFN